MAYLIGNALGVCNGSCPPTGYSNYNQRAYAVVPYPLGWGRFLLDDELDPNPDAPDWTGYQGHWSKIPEYSYRTLRTRYTNNDGTLHQETISTYSKHDAGLEYFEIISGTPDWDAGGPGTVVRTPENVTITYGGGAQYIRQLEDKYYLTEAIALGKTLLDTITLLGHTATYADWADGGNLFHFCYDFEAVSYGYTNYSTSIFGFYEVIRDYPLPSPISAINNRYVKQLEAYLGYQIFELGYSALNGVAILNPDFGFTYSTNDKYTGWLAVGKKAVKLSVPGVNYDVARYSLWSPLTEEYTVGFDLPQPLPIPGEYLFLPEDVNGIGSVSHTTIAPPPYGSMSASSSANIGNNPNPI